MRASVKQRMLLTTGAFVGSHAFLAFNHGGAIGTIIAIAIGYGAWQFADEIFDPINRERDGETSPRLPAGKQGMGYRLITTRSKRMRDWPTDEEVEQYRQQRDEDWLAFDDDDDTSFTNTSIFRFSELLEAGFVPSLDKIFVGRTMEGRDIFVPATKLCHVAIAGKTGGGKGSLMRLIMAQLCFAGAHVLLLNPHYMRMVRAEEGEAFDEDWSPFEGNHPRTGRPYLEKPPIECAEWGAIGNRLHWAVGTLLQGRKAASRESGKRFAPYFIVIDEWPSIAKKIKEAPNMLAELLREGRKFGIFVIVASQDFQVKTIGMEGGSIRKCLLTCFYTGGDPTTAKELLYAEAPRDIPESDLGKGTILMRCTGTENKAITARVPFVENAAIYRLLGPSTFMTRKEQDDIELADDDDDPLANVRIHPSLVVDSPPVPSPWIADRGSRTPEGQNEPENDTDEDLRGSRIPEGWTEGEVATATFIYKNIRNKDDTLKAMGKPQNVKNRQALTTILQEEQE